jgi:hypothetical protein
MPAALITSFLNVQSLRGDHCLEAPGVASGSEILSDRSWPTLLGVRAVPCLRLAQCPGGPQGPATAVSLRERGRATDPRGVRNVCSDLTKTDYEVGRPSAPRRGEL